MVLDADAAVQHLEEVQAKMKEVRKKGVANLRAAQEKQKERFDLKRRGPAYKVCMKVHLHYTIDLPIL